MSNPVERHLTWERFEERIRAVPPSLHTLHGEPLVEIFTDNPQGRIGIRITSEAGALLPVSSLVAIDIRRREDAGTTVLEVSSTRRELFRDFYAFVCGVADRIQLDGVPAGAAIEAELSSWKRLLERSSGLTLEEEIGLFGELWMLNRLASSIDWAAALEAWKGFEREEHDFGLEKVDIEVKTTSSEKRIHVIGGLDQLRTSPDRDLYLLSIQLTRSGNRHGRTLGEVVDSMLEQISRSTPALVTKFEEALHEIRYHDEERHLYTTRRHLRSHPSLIKVDESFPSLLRDDLEALGGSRAERVVDATYRIDVAGLGVEDESPEFLRVIPRGAQGMGDPPIPGPNQLAGSEQGGQQ